MARENNLPAFDRAYHTDDKSEWGPGPWQDEPDKVQWVDEETGLDCLIVRNHGGALCGYVGVGPEHPWYQKDYDYVRPYPDVHGGLTYANKCQTGVSEEDGICHVPLPGRSEDVWWLGFDTAHSGDYVPAFNASSLGVLDDVSRNLVFGLPEQYRDLSYVVGEVRSLASQAQEAQLPS